MIISSQFLQSVFLYSVTLLAVNPSWQTKKRNCMPSFIPFPLCAAYCTLSIRKLLMQPIQPDNEGLFRPGTWWEWRRRLPPGIGSEGFLLRPQQGRQFSIVSFARGRFRSQRADGDSKNAVFSACGRFRIPAALATARHTAYSACGGGRADKEMRQPDCVYSARGRFQRNSVAIRRMVKTISTLTNAASVPFTPRRIE